MIPPVERVPLRAIFSVFFKIGAMSFGDGLIAWIHRETVIMRTWLNQEQFLSGLALGQVLPGANVTNMAIYVGQKLRGPLGAFIAVVSVLTGPFFLCIALASVYDDLVKVPYFHAAMDGIAAAAIGMIVRLGVMGSGCLRKLAPALIAPAIFVAIGVLKWPMLPVIAVCAPVSVWCAWPRAKPDA